MNGRRKEEKKKKKKKKEDASQVLPITRDGVLFRSTTSAPLCYRRSRDKVLPTAVICCRYVKCKLLVVVSVAFVATMDCLRKRFVLLLSFGSSFFLQQCGGEEMVDSSAK